ncbi:transcriptional activator CMR1 [Fusarium pseudoanthophilum]|uniref:Transcriptional activator CMR1 n=1 Tax=Fusarium pseudoanthophilum TaxID=48495 RepID=A0A8H5KPA3_9HYPO|nr:transcriptional activator CMR1 [Fusarium pseudoanthophilum]
MPTAPDPRRGRACDACHANKTKCDGGSKCTLCVKRGINCTYKHASKSSSGSKSPSEDITADPRTVANGFTSPALIQNLTPGTPQISPNDEIKAGFKRIANHVRSGEIPIGEDTPVPALDKNWIEGNSKEYFGRFHDTWPILHGPSYVTMDTSLLVSVSIAMISCWLRSPDEFEDVVLQLHESLMGAFSDWIANPRSRHEYDEPWPFETYQAILMNIIFAFYHGKEKLVSKASLLRGTFVVALREAEFFNSDNAAEQQRVHYPGTFVPWLMTIRDRWKRLIVSLFKIDTYLSIARFQAPTLFREEIDLTMPATYSLWNAYGLNIFFKRITLEPTDRSNFKLSEVIANPNTPAKPLLLFEDIHLALCGLLPAIWNQTQIVRRSTEAGRSTQNSTSSLAWQLEAWKADIERVKHQCCHAAEVGEFPFTAYIGDYDEDPARAKALAISNIKCLISECLMTYHLQGLQLYADPRMINSVAMASIVSPDHEAGVRPRVQKLHTQLNIWAKSPESRRALLHALAVLRQCESDLQANEPQTQSIDPTSYLAISMSALVVWAWLMFSEAACSCVPTMNHINIGDDPLDLQNTARLETWIQAEGTAGMNNIPLCRCVSEGWMARFNALLPLGRRRWEMSDEVAPILNPLSAGR